VKKRYVIIGLLASSLAFGQKQQANGTFSKAKIRRTDIQALFSYYTQDNNHSAVTGGIGTEDLQVYVQDYTLNWSHDSIKSTGVEFGADIISSASTDNIDDVFSSASREDFRFHATLDHNRNLKNGWNVSGNTAVSLESDYLSIGPGISVGRQSDDQSREWSVSLQTYFDDLRWKNTGEPHILIYPDELRYKEWFKIYKRNSYNLSFSHYRTINRRIAFGFYPGIAYQNGLLSTPFHRVYFADDSERVENLPRKRFKIPIGTQLNMFLGKMWIVRTYYRFYWDDFGITAHTIDVETPVKITQNFTVSPFIRLYTQTGSNFFKPYAKHELAQDYYTSDYDLSKFSSYKTGLGLRFTPFGSEARRWSFNDIEVRYALYKRSDGLLAHTLTAFISISQVRKK
jgi:hypothetical protein